MPKVKQRGSDRAGSVTKVWSGSNNELLLTAIGQGSIAPAPMCYWAGVAAGVGCEVRRWDGAGVFLCSSCSRHLRQSVCGWTPHPLRKYTEQVTWRMNPMLPLFITCDYMRQALSSVQGLHVRMCRLCTAQGHCV